MSSKKAIITGSLGQTGSYMCDYLRLKGLDVIGSDIDLEFSDSIYKLIGVEKPDYFFNFGAKSSVADSWDSPVDWFEINSRSVFDCLEAIRLYSPKTRFFNAGSSEELLEPKTPYGTSKIIARNFVNLYRSKGIYAIQATLFNHSSPRQKESFVARKITKGLASIKNDVLNNKSFEPIELGNVDSKRDWTDARSIVRGVWLMLNQDEAKDYVLSSGKARSVRDFFNCALKHLWMKGSWHGNGTNEQFSVDKETIQRYGMKSSVLVIINKEFYRPCEVELFYGDSTKAREELGWNSEEFSFDNMVADMINEDLKEYGN